MRRRYRSNSDDWTMTTKGSSSLQRPLVAVDVELRHYQGGMLVGKRAHLFMDGIPVRLRRHRPVAGCPCSRRIALHAPPRRQPANSSILADRLLVMSSWPRQPGPAALGSVRLTVSRLRHCGGCWEHRDFTSTASCAYYAHLRIRATSWYSADHVDHSIGPLRPWAWRGPLQVDPGGADRDGAGGTIGEEHHLGRDLLGEAEQIGRIGRAGASSDRTASDAGRSGSAAHLNYRPRQPMPEGSLELDALPITSVTELEGVRLLVADELIPCNSRVRDEREVRRSLQPPKVYIRARTSRRSRACSPAGAGLREAPPAHSPM